MWFGMFANVDFRGVTSSSSVAIVVNVKLQEQKARPTTLYFPVFGRAI